MIDWKKLWDKDYAAWVEHMDSMRECDYRIHVDPMSRGADLHGYFTLRELAQIVAKMRSVQESQAHTEQGEEQ